jgi:hypothetical protein
LSIDANGIVTVAANTQVVASPPIVEANPSTGLKKPIELRYRYSTVVVNNPIDAVTIHR